mgnify:FL=1
MNQWRKKILEQTLRIKVSKKPPESGGVVSYKSKRLKRGLFKKMFGTDPDKVTIIVPGEDVASVEIITIPDRAEAKHV